MSDFEFTGSFAEVYDRYLVPMDFAPLGRRLAERVAALAPRSVLETAAGTGVVTRELARIPLPSQATQTAPVCARISAARAAVTTSSSPLAMMSNATLNPRG